MSDHQKCTACGGGHQECQVCRIYCAICVAEITGKPNINLFGDKICDACASVQAGEDEEES